MKFMGDIVASAIQAGQGNSGDVVRAFTASAEVLALHDGVRYKSPTTFWRRYFEEDGNELTMEEECRKSVELCVDDVLALVKLTVLEWSQEFNYQIYHDLPMSLVVG
jgi:hypothetical protein